jgi:hypothetical protein
MNNKTENLLSALEKIKQLISRYENISEIPEIERDILLSAIRDMYSGLLLMPPVKPAPAVRTDVPSSRPSETIEPAKSMNFDAEVTVEKAEFHDEDQQLKLKKEPIPPRKTSDKKKARPEILGDKLKGEKQFVYETLAEKAVKQNISTQLQSKPILSISSAIGINDKFKLIRDLFNDDSESYAKTISKLDSCNDFNEAFNYITTSFNWDMEDESVQFILDLVRRKFIVKKDE